MQPRIASRFENRVGKCCIAPTGKSLGPAGGKRQAYLLTRVIKFLSRGRGLTRCGIAATSRKERAIARFLAFSLLYSLVGVAARAQNGPDNDANGAPGYTKSVFDHGQIDSVNLYNGQLTIPLALGGSYPIGPTLRVQVTMTYNSRATDYGGPSAGWQAERLKAPDNLYEEP